jgi:hypothetical protein
MHDSESMLRRCLLDAPLARGMTAAFVAVLFLGPVVMSNAAAIAELYRAPVERLVDPETGAVAFLPG